MRALYLPLIPWHPASKSFTPGEGPDRLELYRRLASQGIAVDVLDPGNPLWNRIAGTSPFLGSLDPFRALRVALLKRRYDVVIGGFHSSATSLLLLKAVSRFPTPVVLWDITLTEGWKLGDRILDFTVPRTSGIMVLGASQKAHIERRWSNHPPIEVIGHGVDASFYS